MAAALIVLMVLFFVVVWFIVENWVNILIVLAIALLISLIGFVIHRDRLDAVVSARITAREPIVERVAEKTGYSVGYGYYYSYREHFRYRNVVTGYKVTFAVEYHDKTKETVVCKEGSYTYGKLIKKI